MTSPGVEEARVRALRRGRSRVRALRRGRRRVRVKDGIVAGLVVEGRG